MAKIKEFTVSRGLTIGGYENDKPFFSMTVTLEDGDDFEEEVAKAIETVNATVLVIHESEA